MINILPSNSLRKAFIPLKKSRYITLVIVLAPVLNFLSGLNIDIYAPSMPTMAHYFLTNITTVKYTIAVSVLGIASGSLVFGVLIDNFGRKPLLLFSLMTYCILCFLSPFSHTINEIILLRFVQGVMISCISIGCRALIVDNVKGHRYKIAILYTSLGYGLGPVVGPFIGGWLQLYFGWSACFYVLSAISLILCALVIIFVKEKNGGFGSLGIMQIYFQYKKILSHKKFMANALILGIVQIELLSYPTFGPFIVEVDLKRSVLMYSYTALLVGLSYLAGNLINRLLLNYLCINRIMFMGILILIIGLVFSYLFSCTLPMSMVTVCLPVMIICFAAGFLFSNIMGENLRLFPNTTGIAMAVLAALLTGIAAIGIGIESLLNINRLAQLSSLYTVLIILQACLFIFTRSY